VVSAVLSIAFCLAFVAVPAAAALALSITFPRMRWFVVLPSAVGAACAYPAILVMLTNQADGITRAGGIMLATLAFPLGLLVSGVTFALRRKY
jgi:hypothetical protein